MTSTSSVGESTVVSRTLQRDFLLQRLMEDSQRLRNNEGRISHSPTRNSNGSRRRRKRTPIKNGTGSSSSATAEDTDRTDSEENEDAIGKLDHGDSVTTAAANFQGRQNQQSRRMFSSGLELFNSPLHQYAATLAAAHFMQAAAAGFPPVSTGHPASALPLLVEQYPILFPNLLANTASFANGNGPDSPSGIFPNAKSEKIDSGKQSRQTPAKIAAPNTTEKRLASISLASPQQKNATPSPRKRAPPKTKDSTKAHSPAPGSAAGTPKKARAIRRIQFDDEMCSPVSGMYIKDLDECSVIPAQSPSSQGDADAQQLLDDSARWVDVTEEAKAELAKIPNIIGDYICRLCKVRYADAFQLAKHRCPRIAHEEYRCPECDKVFSCPANLASHRRWHKPKDFIIAIDQKRQSETAESIDQFNNGDKIERATDSTFSNEDIPIDLTNRELKNYDSNGKERGECDGDEDDEEGEEQKWTH